MYNSYLANIDWRRIGRYAAVIRTTLAVDKLWLADGWIHHRGRWTGLSDASQFRRSRAMALFARRFGIHQTFADFHSHIAKLARSLGRCIDDVCRSQRIKLVGYNWKYFRNLFESILVVTGSSSPGIPNLARARARALALAENEREQLK
jgi:hypothetical protein